MNGKQYIAKLSNSGKIPNDKYAQMWIINQQICQMQDQQGLQGQHLKFG